jgi:hypothetical protein
MHDKINGTYKYAGEKLWRCGSKTMVLVLPTRICLVHFNVPIIRIMLMQSDKSLVNQVLLILIHNDYGTVSISKLSIFPSTCEGVCGPQTLSLESTTTMPEDTPSECFIHEGNFQPE